MILHGPGAAEDRWDNDDIAIYETIGKKGELMLPGYKSMNIAKELYTVYGGEVDWLHQMRGVFTFTNELFTPFNYFRKPSDGGVFGKQEEQQTVQQVAPVRRRARPLARGRAPAVRQESKSAGSRKTGFGSRRRSCLEEECHRNMAFSLYHADQMPQVKSAVDRGQAARRRRERSHCGDCQSENHPDAFRRRCGAQDHGARHRVDRRAES